MRARIVLMGLLAFGLYRCESDSVDTQDGSPRDEDSSIRDGGTGGDVGLDRSIVDAIVEDRTRDQSTIETETDADARGDGDAGLDSGRDASDGSSQCSEAGCNQCSGSSPNAQWIQDFGRDLWKLWPGPSGIVHGLTRDKKFMRWNGSQWSQFTVQPSLDEPYSVSSPSPNEVWSASSTELWRWNGSAWTDLTALVPKRGQPLFGVRSAWAFGPNDAWVITSALDVDGLARWNGSAFVPATVPAGGDPNMPMADLWASSPEDVWAVHGPKLLHFNGASWAYVTGVPTPKLNALIGPIWGFSNKDVWVASYGEIYHFDGAGWTTYPIESDAPYDRPLAIWGACPTDIWAFGYRRLLHYDGFSWESTVWNEGWSMTSLAGAGVDDVWFAGQRSNLVPPVLLHRTVPGCDGGDCSSLSCGNLLLEPGEACDPPNGSSCGPACALNCGNNQLDPGEECDPPDGANCLPGCRVRNPVCGNNIVEGPEECDEPYAAFCASCQETDCAAIYEGCSRQACQGLTGDDAANCRALQACTAFGKDACQGGGHLATCYCAVRDDAGACLLAGVCQKQIEAVAHSTDEAEVMSQMRSATSVLGKIAQEALCVYNTPYPDRWCYPPYPY